MKKPEEIKKGLECRIRSYTDTCNHQCDTCDLRIPAYSIYERYEDALALIQQLEAQVPRWISVEERKPEQGQLVLFIPTCNENSVYVGKLSHVGGRGSIMFENWNTKAKTKYYSRWWMPLPLPPSSPVGESTFLGDGGSGTN